MQDKNLYIKKVKKKIKYIFKNDISQWWNVSILSSKAGLPCETFQGKSNITTLNLVFHIKAK